MHENLPELKRELRRETCPQRVVDAAMRRIAAESAPPSYAGYAIAVALACLVLVCGLLIWRQPATGNSIGQPASAKQRQVQAPTEIARETANALNLFGTLLLDAGTKSGTVITTRAVPPLRRGFETAKNLINQNTEL